MTRGGLSTRPQLFPLTVLDFSPCAHFCTSPDLPNDIIYQLTGDISHLKIGVLKEGFGLPSSEADVDMLVRNAAYNLGRHPKATVEEVSVKMHLDGN